MADVILAQPFGSDGELVRLAREIAMDIAPIETILENNKIDQNKWETLKKLPRFTQVLEAEVAAWNSALNTAERTKLKAGAMIEEWLPEAYARMNDNAESLPAKVELAKLVSRIAGVGVNGVGVEGGGGERFTITINLGADQQLRIEKELPPRTIDAEVASNA